MMKNNQSFIEFETLIGVVTENIKVKYIFQILFTEV